MTTLRTNSKTLVLIGLVAVLAVSAVALTGCIPTGDAQRIAQLEQELANLKNQNSTNTNNTTDATQQQNTQQQNTQQQAPATATTQTAIPAPGESSDATVKDLNTRADALVAEADAVQYPGNLNSAISTYMSYNQQFEMLEHEIDMYENQKELEYRNGTIDWNTWRMIDVQLETIEQKLDFSQESMELRFGIDD